MTDVIKQNNSPEPFYGKDQFSQLYLQGRTQVFTFYVPFPPLETFTDPNDPGIPYTYTLPLPQIVTMPIIIFPVSAVLIDVIILGENGETVQLQQFREGTPGFNTVDILPPTAMTGPNAIRPTLKTNKFKPLDRLVITAPAGTFVTFTIKYK